MSRLLSLYHKLPPIARHAVASLRGYQLRQWRYTSETEALVEQYLERDTWSSEQWQAYQAERLAYMLHRAANHVPYYREQWAKRRRNGDKRSYEYLENWDILSKDTLRANPQSFVADDCDIDKMYHEHTSGTSGKPLDLWWSRETVVTWYALFEARWRRWYDVSRFDRWAIFGGQLVTPASQTKPPFWVWNHALSQLYMSSYHLAPDLIPHYLDALAKYKIKYLWGYTSSLYALAQGALKHQRDDIQFTVMIANAEPVYDYQRQTIETAFNSPLRETYGMAEIVLAASECEAGNLHLWPEVGILETVDNDGATITDGAEGNLVCTGLFNADMPLIRYAVGDRGVYQPEHVNCSCGRTLPLLESVSGRVDDVLYTSDGRHIGRLDPVFKQHLPLIEAQIIQEALDKLLVKYVPDTDFTPETIDEIRHQLQARMGDIKIQFEEVAEIPRTNNGKFRAVISLLSDEERASVM